MASTDSILLRIGGVSAIAGALAVLTGTMLHPLDADPADAIAAFTEYAADTFWVTSHLIQYSGIVLLGVALFALARSVEPDHAAAWARIGVFGASASIAATAALQAVDGVALKIMVDRWAVAAGSAKELAFEGAFAVRQIEVGLASLMSITFGLTVMVFGVALVLGRQHPRWLGWASIVGGIGTVAGGLAQAYTGFSSLAMIISMPAGVVLLVWAIGIGVWMVRHAGTVAAEHAA